ncbi:hypothetical protein D3OALGA1CA_4092 [Olavius algarvensis associated proteobacterium Delta 3]|nr:hypothetical protein D3OALGB2SA_1006 [Olavius algarvensis associated proteobacterium Delta 3]CAB5145083.1 hypothetical protein D3OALGA1CA_4092 [Olavius algarvensis associated proteobacterium Delta 3]
MRENFGRLRSPPIVFKLIVMAGGMPEKSVIIDELRQRVAELEAALVQNEAARAKQKRLAARTIEAQKMEALGGLAGGIAHEFNNALNGISGNIELLMLDRAEDVSVRRYAERMMISVQRMAELTRKLVAYASGGKYQLQHIVLDEFIDFAIATLETDIDPDIHIDIELAPEPLAVEADVTQLHMVFAALIRNAAEAIEGPGRIQVQTRREIVNYETALSHPGLHRGDYSCLIIADTGDGMDERIRNRIFEPFFTTKFPGRGLGMAAAYGIVKSHDGWIGVNSSAGLGTKISLFLPRIEIDETLRWSRQLNLPLQYYSS